MDMVETLTEISQKISGEWKNNVLIDNDTDNSYVDAYNEGVKAMAHQVCSYLSSYILAAEIQRDGTQVTFVKVGDEP